MAEEKKTRIRMNLAAIQKVDPYAKEILDSSSHVAYYTFKNKEWEKSDIEGK
jgi:mRNA-decapping enzyme 1B